MLEKKVKLTSVGDLKVAPRIENGNIVKDANGNDLTYHYRYVVFESSDYKRDMIPIKLYHDDAKDFALSVGTEGLLQFTCNASIRTSKQDNEQYLLPDLRMINFVPSY